MLLNKSILYTRLAFYRIISALKLFTLVTQIIKRIYL